MSFVDVVLHDGELLQGPFFNVNQELYFITSSRIKPCYRLLKLWEKLFVVGVNKSQAINGFVQTSKHSGRNLDTL